MAIKDVEFYFNSLITTRVILSPGEMITETSNLDDPKACEMYMDQFCTSFHVSDPKIYGKHHDIVFIVTNKGVFQSLDDSGIWSHTSTWYLC